MSDTTTVDPTVAPLTRIGDAIYSHKNALVAAIAANTAALTALATEIKSDASPAASGSGATSGAASAAAPPAASSPAAVIATGQTAMAVGPTRTIKEPADALQYLADGATITLDDATYVKAFHNTVKGLTVVSASGMPRLCTLDGQYGHGAGHDMAYHKGMIHSGLPITIKGIGFVRCGGINGTDTYSNEAAVWLGDSSDTTTTPATSPTTVPWKATITGCTFDDCANGIFTSSEPALTLEVTGNVFGFKAPNGMNAAAASLGAHPAHDIYFEGGEIDATGNYFYGGPSHNVKTRSGRTTVTGNPLMCQDGGRVLDACEGGYVTFSGNQCWTRTDRQGQAIGANTGAYGNSNLLEYALENTNHGAPGAVLSSNTFHISRNSSTIACPAGATITSTGDQVIYYDQGSLVLQGNVVGLTQGGALPGAGSAPPLPAPPAWAA